MIEPSAIRRPARVSGLAGLVVVALAFLVACTSSSASPSVVPPATASPVAVASPDAASPSADAASPSADAASPSPSKAPERYYTGDPTPTPKPAAGSHPSPRRGRPRSPPHSW
jgi:hypothetical protein